MLSIVIKSTAYTIPLLLYGASTTPVLGGEAPSTPLQPLARSNSAGNQTNRRPIMSSRRACASSTHEPQTERSEGAENPARRADESAQRVLRAPRANPNEFRLRRSTRQQILQISKLYTNSLILRPSRATLNSNLLYLNHFLRL